MFDIFKSMFNSFHLQQDPEQKTCRSGIYGRKSCWTESFLSSFIVSLVSSSISFPPFLLHSLFPFFPFIRHSSLSSFPCTLFPSLVSCFFLSFLTFFFSSSFLSSPSFLLFLFPSFLNSFLFFLPPFFPSSLPPSFPPFFPSFLHYFHSSFLPSFFILICFFAPFLIYGTHLVVLSQGLLLTSLSYPSWWLV